MKKHILVIVLVFLFLFSSVVILSSGHYIKTKITKSENSRNIAYAEASGFGLVSFDLELPGDFTIICDGIGGFAAAGTWAKCHYYITGYYGATLYIVNLTSCDLIPVGGSGTEYNGIAYDITTNTMYGVSSYNLYRIDMYTGAQTLIGSWGSSYLMIDIGCDNEGYLYGHDIVTDSMYLIDKNTGTATLLGPTGISCNYAQGMEYDHDNGILYASAFTNSGALYKVDTVTGLFTLIGEFPEDAAVDALAIPYENWGPYAPTIYGPKKGYSGVNYNFYIQICDCEEDYVSIFVDWGDNTNSGWLGPYTSGSKVEKNQTYLNPGVYHVKAKTKDSFYESSWSNTIKIEISSSAPENPKIFGPTSGKIKTEIEFTFVATDPNENQLYYMIRWGDGIEEDWFGPYNSDEEIKKNYSWKKEGNWYIQAKVKDTDGLESNWSTLIINIPRIRNLMNPLFLSFIERLPILQ